MGWSHGGVLRHSMTQPHFYSHNGKVEVATLTTTTTTPMRDEDGNILKHVRELRNHEKKYKTVMVYQHASSHSKKKFVKNKTPVKVLGEEQYWRHVGWVDEKSGKHFKGWVNHENLKSAIVKIKEGDDDPLDVFS